MATRILNKIYMYIMGIMIFFMSSCITAQTTIGAYHKVYYDYVVGGVVNEIGFVNDGYNSYHIITKIPVNTYWELCPVGHEIYIYNKSLTYKKIFRPNNRWIFYNKHRHHIHNPKFHNSYHNGGYNYKHHNHNNVKHGNHNNYHNKHNNGRGRR